MEVREAPFWRHSSISQGSRAVPALDAGRIKVIFQRSSIETSAIPGFVRILRVRLFSGVICTHAILHDSIGRYFIRAEPFATARCCRWATVITAAWYFLWQSNRRQTDRPQRCPPRFIAQSLHEQCMQSKIEFWRRSSSSRVVFFFFSPCTWSPERDGAAFLFPVCPTDRELRSEVRFRWNEVPPSSANELQTVYLRSS